MHPSNIGKRVLIRLDNGKFAGNPFGEGFATILGIGTTLVYKNNEGVTRDCHTVIIRLPDGCICRVPPEMIRVIDDVGSVRATERILLDLAR